MSKRPYFEDKNYLNFWRQKCGENWKHSQIAFSIFHLTSQDFRMFHQSSRDAYGIGASRVLKRDVGERLCWKECLFWSVLSIFFSILYSIFACWIWTLLFQKEFSIDIQKAYLRIGLSLPQDIITIFHVSWVYPTHFIIGIWLKPNISKASHIA